VRRFVALLLALFALVLPAGAGADPADVNAAARGVVRVVIVGEEDGEVFPVSHGTGFAVSPERIVTNAHVVLEAREDKDLSIAIVPSDGASAVYGKIVAFSPRNDLALLATTESLRLPPLSFSTASDADAGSVTAVGYPSNVDRAQGLDLEDIFSSQPPVKSAGFLAGRRPTRDFDTLLHTAPIARGSSGGPLLDDCGRVVGINSFGTESDGTDAEFFFAASTRELLPFLRENGITPQANGSPCRSLADLDKAERERLEREQMLAREKARADALARGQSEERLRDQALFSIMNERELRTALALLLLLGAAGAGYVAWQAREAGDARRLKLAGGASGVLVLILLGIWFTKPGLDSLDDLVLEMQRAAEEPDDTSSPAAPEAQTGYRCVVDVERSRVTTTETEDVDLTWQPDGCVNMRTQYGRSEGGWSRVLVPNDEAAVSVNRFDPQTGEFRTERYLLGREAMETARKARGEYKAPACGAGPAAVADLGNFQQVILNQLPTDPNERIVYKCSEAQPAE
jgi:serine protease Do